MKFLLSVILILSSVLVKAASFTGADGKAMELENPKRVIALNSSTVEILAALGKGDLIVGIDKSAQYPENIIKGKADLGHPYRPSAEGMISLKPDLVIAPEENLPSATAEQLRSAKIPVLVIENSAKDGVEGLKRRVTLLGQIFNSAKEANALLNKINKGMESLKKEVSKNNLPPKIFFLYAHGAGATFIYGKETGSHILIEAVGGKNSADFTSGTKPLTAEAMVQASPDVIIMLNRGFKSVGGLEGVMKLPGVALTPAGKNKAIIQVDDSIRWIGPRFPEFAQNLLNDINSLKK